MIPIPCTTSKERDLPAHGNRRPNSSPILFHAYPTTTPIQPTNLSLTLHPFNDVTPSTLPLPFTPMISNLQSQISPHAVPDPSLKLPSPLPPHLRGFHIGRTLIIRLCQHAHHTDQYLLHALYRAPPLTGLLIVVGIITWRM